MKMENNWRWLLGNLIRNGEWEKEWDFSLKVSY
jgi:hypothetical protein